MCPTDVELDGRLDEISKRCLPILGFYKDILGENSDDMIWLIDKLDLVQYFWRYIPDKLLYPALDKWEKALEAEIDPLQIFLLGWESCTCLNIIETKMDSSLRGRFHRWGITSTPLPDLKQYEEVYTEYMNKKASGKKDPLKLPLGQKIGYQDEKELERIRAKFYRIKRAIDREKHKGKDIELPSENTQSADCSENKTFISNLRNRFFDYLVRHICIFDYTPQGIHICTMQKSTGARTLFEHFIHENADSEIWFEKGMKSLLKIREKEEKKKKGKNKKISQNVSRQAEVPPQKKELPKKRSKSSRISKKPQ